jgi:predicted phosphodiesterase
MATDWHWGEVVEPGQIGGVNLYNMEVSKARAKAFVTNTVDLLKNHMVNPDYPGIVLMLGGDMVSGTIHDELVETNEQPIMPVVLDLFGVLSWVVKSFADEFGRVLVPAVRGNHGRTTHKPRHKDSAFLSYDWLLYQMLAKRFEEDKRVTFQIPDGPDALFTVYGHRFLLTHGDQFRGGDGMIGALGPIIRGDHKKRSRNAQVAMEYDTLVLGHWHQLIQMQRLIVGGTLKGYDEFAYDNNFPYEPPRQALWLVHPARGITFSMPVLLEEKRPEAKDPQWVQVFKG